MTMAKHTMHASTGSSAIRIDRVTKTFDVPGGTVEALSETSLDIAEGRFAVLVGPSGCGKSTLLMMIAGLETPTSGRIRIGDEVITKPNPNLIGIIFQDSNLFPWLTARENVEFPLMLSGVPRAERTDRAMEMLKLVKLEGFAESRPHQLSGGMRQRVSIARGLVQQPPVLLMDEPFAALDEQTRLELGDELLRIWDVTKQTVVFVTHSLTEAAYLADEVNVMAARPGRIIDHLKVDFARPRTMKLMETEAFGVLRGRIWDQIRTSK